MTKRHFPALVALVFAILFGLLLGTLDAPVRAQGPVGNALATLAAATFEAQQTRQAQEQEAARQRLTATAIALDQIRGQQTRQAADHATASALSTQATRQAMDTHATRERHAANATAFANDLNAEQTRQAMYATATVEAFKVGQMRDGATATAAGITAVAISAQETRIFDERRAQNEASARGVELFALATLGLAMLAVLVEIVRRWRATPHIVEVVAAAQPQPNASGEPAPIETRMMIIDEELATNLERILENELVAISES